MGSDDGVARFVWRWLTTTNHKDIGILYIVTSIYFFIVAGVLALLFRTQLAYPDSQFLTGKQYYEAVTVHGLIMLLWFASPLAIGLANYIVPLQIGARDLAFPRLNALSYWLYLFSGIMMLATFFTKEGAPEVGWTLYAPLTARDYTPGAGLDLAALAIVVLSLSITIGTINFLVTIAVMRAPGLGWMKLPMFTWSILFTIILMLYAFPPLMVGAAVLWLDRNLGTEFFSSPAGGALLWDHLFWFFGHPEVYILLFPALGIIADVVSTFARRPLYAKKYILFALFAATVLSFLVWMHHMFVTGTNLQTRLFYSVTTILISIPFEMATLSLILTLYKGKIRYTVPMLFAIAGIFNFILGGATGVYLGSIAIDKGFRGTYWVVAHFHYILVGTMVLGLMAGLYYWLPKMTGRMYNERWGLIHFVLSMIGVTLTFLPQFFIFDMPRRYFVYDNQSWLLPNQISTIGAMIFGVATVIGLANLAYSAFRGPRAPDNPWNAWTLEWLTRSPVPRHNFDGVPVITSDNRVVMVSESLLEDHGADAVIKGQVKALPALTGASGNVEHHEHNTIDPLILALGISITAFTLAFTTSIMALAPGLIITAYALYRWLKADVEEKFYEKLKRYLESWPFPHSKMKTGVWVLVASEIMLFGSLISIYFFVRFNPVGKILLDAWPPGYMIHDVNVGLINTVVLFTGTLAFALSYVASREGDYRMMLTGFLLTLFFYTLFLVIKYFEWSELIAAGYGLGYGLAMQTYFTLTGAHALHVFLGLLATLYLTAKLFRGKYNTPQFKEEVLAVAIYWGIVEMVWVLLFPLFYLM